MNKKGKYIIVDGIDGSEKSVLIKALFAYLVANGKNVFNLTEFARINGFLPSFQELSRYDAIFANEPTYAYAGKAIREEIILASHGRKYPPLFIAEGYSVDRGVLDMRVTCPALANGITVVKDRGLTTTLVYQTVQGVPLNSLLSLEGNKIALETPPDIIVIADCPPDVALSRTTKRFDKQDDAIFERIDFLKKADVAFKSEWFRNIFESRGSKIIYFDTNRDEETEKKEFMLFIIAL